MPRGDDDRSDFNGVYLVGAGPGDPELLTRRAYNLIMDADVIVYDRLVAPEILELIPEQTEKIDVGKRPDSHPVPQNGINILLAYLARDHRSVVRLKGGDPFIFGRGSEEAAYLREQNIQCYIVPGITAATGCAAAAGVPLTHRGLATGVRYVTGHCRENVDLDLDWRGMADPDTTLVIYMGAQNMMQIAVRLITEGMPATTPAIAISNGTTPRQQVVTASLADIATAASDKGLMSPVMFVIGRVVSLAGTLGGVCEDAVIENPRAEHAVR
ncbi:MAG: uroporphyrinogen-III C-methyltransferase [Rhodospirillales bacterium]|nr:uroporphyrinogen-III C-methyltransferase [Rhodospirillales bacterium]